jgi:hypothetical protein
MSQSTVDPNAELRAAQAAVQQQRHPEAVPHLARIIPEYASHPAVTALLEQLVSTAPEPLALVPSGQADYGTAAVHAWALGQVGRAGEAYGILRQLAHATAGNGIIDWALPWLYALEPAQREEAIVLFFISAHNRFGGRKDLDPAAVEIVQRWLPHVGTMMASRPFTDQYFQFYIPLLRQAGAMDEAIRVARARHEACKSYPSATSLATTLRQARDYDGFFAVSRELVALAPEDVPARLDLGDCCWEEVQKLDGAETWYADAVRLAPDHEWATPSLLAVRYLRTREVELLEQLEDYIAAHPGNQRAAVCLGRVTPFFADFIYPGDASINNLNEIAQQVEQAMAAEQGGSPTGTIRLSVTGLDVPSCQRSIDRQLGLWGGGIKLERTVLGMQSPDPRAPRVPVQFRLWTFEDLTPQPAVGLPSAEVSEMIAALARTRYDLGVWSEYAGNVASRLGEANLAGLLGVMVFPPDPPQGWRMWDWTSRVQMAAMLVLAAQAAPGSTARQALIDLANGPLDWPTAAAVVALTALARSQLAFAPEVRQLFAAVYQGLPRPGADYYENVLLNCHLRLPGVPPEEREAVRAERRRYFARTSQRMTPAEVASRIFLARERPEDVAEDDIARIVIQAFSYNVNRDHPGFAGALRGSMMFTDAMLASAEGDRKKYFEEQARVLRLIEAEMFPQEASPEG